MNQRTDNRWLVFNTAIFLQRGRISIHVQHFKLNFGDPIIGSSYLRFFYEQKANKIFKIK